MNKYHASLSRAQAVQDAARELTAGLSSSPPDLAVLFASPHHAANLSQLVGELVDRLGTDNLIGCTGESIVAGALEIEDEPAASLWAAWWPQARVDLMHLRFQRTADGGLIEGWTDAVDGDWPAGSTLLTLGEPYSFPTELLLERINQDRPESIVLGGMASGGMGPGESCVVLGKDVHREGAVAALLRDVPVTAVVSQGCRPIGHPLVITQAESNVIGGLGGEKAQRQLRKIYDELPNRDKELVRRGLHLGRVVNEYQERFEHGDFLIRNVTGGDPDDESLVIGDYPRVGQTVQFHVRDALSAHEDLKQLLHRGLTSMPQAPSAALIFTCNGRGSRLFEQPNHDAGLVAQICGDIPAAGCFCQGEMGPVGGKSFLHGFTASIGLFS